MPVFIAALLGGLLQIAASLVGRVLIALGIGVVTYTGAQAVLDVLKAAIIANLQAAGPLIPWLALAKVDVAISIILSAVGIRLVLQGLSAAGSITKFTHK